MNICLDIGHGGSDPGACAGGLQEKDIVLSMGLQAKAALEGLGWGIKVSMTRETDVELSLSDRFRASIAAGAKMTLALHCNAAGPTATGAIGFYWPGNERAKAVARALAESTHMDLRRAKYAIVDVAPNDWRSRAYNVIKGHLQPAICYEMGFLSNVDDRAIMASPEGQRMIVSSIITGVAQFLAMPAPI